MPSSTDVFITLSSFHLGKNENPDIITLTCQVFITSKIGKSICPVTTKNVVLSITFDSLLPVEHRLLKHTVPLITH